MPLNGMNGSGTTGTFLDIRSDPADPACASAVDAEVISRVGAFLRGEEVGLEEVAIDLEPSRMQAYILLGTLYAGERKLSNASEQFHEIIKRLEIREP